AKTRRQAVARPKTDPRWVHEIRGIYKNGEFNARAVVSVLKKRQSLGLVPAGTVPGQRTVARLIKDFERLSLEEQQQYEFFSWPRSMLGGSLPWDASKAALDLLRYHAESRLDNDLPTVREVKWFCRVTQARPDTDIERRVWISELLASHEK